MSQNLYKHVTKSLNQVTPSYQKVCHLAATDGIRIRVLIFVKSPQFFSLHLRVSDIQIMGQVMKVQMIAKPGHNFVAWPKCFVMISWTYYCPSNDDQGDTQKIKHKIVAAQ